MVDDGKREQLNSSQGKATQMRQMRIATRVLRMRKRKDLLVKSRPRTELHKINIDRTYLVGMQVYHTSYYLALKKLISFVIPTWTGFD